MHTAELIRQYWEEHIRAGDYNRVMQERFELEWAASDPPRASLVDAGAKRVGYIVATCSPVTRAHFELAEQAIRDLNLDHLFFIIWPFHYIPGFHAKPLDTWVADQQHLPWEERVDLLTRGVDNPRIRVLTESADWYRESAVNFDEHQPLNAFWTGTWYVIRKLQWQLCVLAGDGIEFYFVCGADQFNPNIKQFIEAGGVEKVWKDYSIVQQLMLHHVYCVQRGADVAPLEEFMPPFGSLHEVVIGAPVPHTTISATQIRFGQLDGLRLEDCVVPAVAVRIRECGWWGYRPLE